MGVHERRASVEQWSGELKINCSPRLTLISPDEQWQPFGFSALWQQSRKIPLMHANLLKQDVTNSALQGLQLMTNNCIERKAGFYMTLESFSNSRKCVRMIAKIEFPVPIHLLDHFIIPKQVQDSLWFLAHIDVKSRRMSFLNLSHACSSVDYPRQKIYRIA